MNRGFAGRGAGSLDLANLRRDFDQSFAREPRQAQAAQQGILAVRVGAGRYVVQSGEIDGVATAGKVIRVPSRSSGLLGVTGIRGALVPVFSLSALLDEAPGETAPGWLFFVGRDDPLAFAFHGIDGYRKVELGAGTPITEAARSHASLREVVTWETDVVPVIHLPTLVSSIRVGTGREATRKEGK